jgi:hypothetical protein
MLLGGTILYKQPPADQPRSWRIRKGETLQDSGRRKHRASGNEHDAQRGPNWNR